MELFNAIRLSKADQEKIFYDNARRFFRLCEYAQPKVLPAA
jgi:predicted TIM-barrel fold metal-dependent hydrolase